MCPVDQNARVADSDIVLLRMDATEGSALAERALGLTQKDYVGAPIYSAGLPDVRGTPLILTPHFG